MTTIQQWLLAAEKALQDANIPSARLDTEIILAHTLRKPRTWLHAHGDEPIDPRHNEIADARLDLRLDRVPVAYIIGHKEFYGRSFTVTPATLIPRPESETIIELLKQLSITPTTQLVDIGTGTGCLGITAKLEYPSLQVTLTDISPHALTIARKNASQLQADVALIESDLLTDYPYTADIILANLPYVDMSWEVSPETAHEPATALFAGDNGMSLMKQLLAQTSTKLAANGHILLEADPQQHHALAHYAEKFSLTAIETQGYILHFKKA